MQEGVNEECKNRNLGDVKKRKGGGEKESMGKYWVKKNVISCLPKPACENCHLCPRFYLKTPWRVAPCWLFIVNPPTWTLCVCSRTHWTVARTQRSAGCSDAAPSPPRGRWRWRQARCGQTPAPAGGTTQGESLPWCWADPRSGPDWRPWEEEAGGGRRRRSVRKLTNLMCLKLSSSYFVFVSFWDKLN